MAAGDNVFAPDVALDSWTAYTPVWSAATVTPTLGNGAIAGRHRITGKTGYVQIMLTWGSTTSSTGSGAWRFSLPFTPVVNGLLSVYVDDNSASQRWAGQARIIGASATGDNMRIVVPTNSTISSNTIPFTWAAADLLILQGTLEIA